MTTNTILWVCIYKYDHEDPADGLVFDDFYLATDYLVEEDFAIVHISNDRAKQGQYWGVRKRSEMGSAHAPS